MVLVDQLVESRLMRVLFQLSEFLSGCCWNVINQLVMVLSVGLAQASIYGKLVLYEPVTKGLSGNNWLTLVD